MLLKAVGGAIFILVVGIVGRSALQSPEIQGEVSLVNGTGDKICIEQHCSILYAPIGHPPVSGTIRVRVENIDGVGEVFILEK